MPARRHASARAIAGIDRKTLGVSQLRSPADTTDQARDGSLVRPRAGKPAVRLDVFLRRPISATRHGTRVGARAGLGRPAELAWSQLEAAGNRHEPIRHKLSCASLNRVTQ